MDLNALPTDRAEIAKLAPEFPRLEPDSPIGCPCRMGEIKRYLRAEGASTANLDLFFGRTALVGDVKFWLRAYDADGTTMFVDVSARGGSRLVSTGSGEGLTPEQYIALRYAQSWSSKP